MNIRRETWNIRREDGIALVVAMMSMLLLTALGMALALTTSSETMIAGNFRNSSEALYAAEAVAERAMDDVRSVAVWDTLLDGSAQSPFVDGAPAGSRTLPDGSTIDLTQAVNMADCRRQAACTAAQMDASTSDRPWGGNNPRWQLYAYGSLNDMTPSGSINSPFYGIAMVADDPSEADGDPTRDAASGNPGSGVLAMRAEAFGPRGAHKVIELTMSRADPTAAGQASIRVLSWREIRSR